jgi:hypothetical protein
MIAENLVNSMIPAVKKNDKAEKAVIWMEELKTNQLPVIDGRNYLGLITVEIILDGNNLDRLVGDFQLYAENCYVYDWQHLFDVVKLLQKCDAEMAAILNERKEFQGVATYEDIVKAFANTMTIQGTGGILVVSLKHIDYSMAEFSRLIEAEGSKIIGCLVAPHPTESDKLYLTLKLNTEDLTVIIAMLERFNYRVVARFHEPANLENEKERLDNLLKYLDI